jgi:hypothetical protein
MTTDFEDQLRERLRAHAETVTPNPETWNRVQEGIRRERRFRWVYAGAAASALAALAAVAVLVLPGLLSESRVELEPGPGLATQPGDPDAAVEDPAPSTWVAPAEMVLATPDGVAILGPGGFGALADPGVFPAESVTVRPGSSLDDLEVVAATECQLRRYQREPAGVASHDISTVDPAACATGPRFSPDGESLAWIEEDADGIALATVGWSAGGDGEQRWRNARFGLDLSALADGSGDGAELGEVGEVRVTGWVWRESGDGGASGFLTLAVHPRGDGGGNRLLTLEIERQGDGALALPSGDAPTLFDDGFRRFVAYRRTPSATWTLDVREDGETVLTREDDGVALNDLSVFGPSGLGDAGPVWLEVAGETAIVGDGRGGAWQVTFDGGFGAVEPLASGPDPLEILHATVLLGMAADADPAAPVPSEEPSPQPTAVPTVEPTESEPVAEEPVVEPDHSGLPPAVSQRRDAIRAAARAGDLDALAAQADPDEFSYSFGEDGDPVGFWRREIANGIDVMGQLLAVTDLPSAQVQSEGGPEITTWPWVHDVPYERLSSAELVMLEDALGSQVMDTYRDTGQYLGYRVGIRANGSFIYFIAGD